MFATVGSPERMAIGPNGNIFVTSHDPDSAVEADIVTGATSTFVSLGVTTRLE